MSVRGPATPVPDGEYKTQGHGERVLSGGLPFRVLHADGVRFRCYCRDAAKCGCVERILDTYEIAAL